MDLNIDLIDWQPHPSPCAALLSVRLALMTDCVIVNDGHDTEGQHEDGNI